jgi:hypothetical protein
MTITPYMRLQTRSLIGVLVLAALTAVPATASASDDTLLGFGDDLVRVTRGAPGVAGTSELARIMVDYADVRSKGWADVDAAVDAARASGQQLAFTVTDQVAPDLADWQLFLAELAARYPDLWAVQAWNEPNLANIGGDLAIDQTVAIVQAARVALPGVRLIGPAVSPTVDGAAAYQSQLYAALPDDIGVGVNIYTYRDAHAIEDVVADYRQAKADGGGAEVYVVEIGFHAAYFSNQALASAQAFEALRQEGAAAVLFYRLLANPVSASNWELGGKFAVLNDDLSPTPVLLALRGAATTQIDIQAPLLELGKPEVDSEARKAKVEFSATDDLTPKKGIAFTCELDKRPAKSCSSPVVFKRLDSGKHRLDVTATDATGNATTEATTFKVKKNPKR